MVRIDKAKQDKKGMYKNVLGEKVEQQDLGLRKVWQLPMNHLYLALNSCQIREDGRDPPDPEY